MSICQAVPAVPIKPSAKEIFSKVKTVFTECKNVI
nr:MAG TPA: PHAGOCYTE NADPH OXIDASE SUBUNIT P67PHOX/PHAGOCYTE, P47PHOX, SH3-PEPTIDE COMPLEX, HELIX-TURN-HELIX [Caudoviricetes sp.]